MEKEHHIESWTFRIKVPTEPETHDVTVARYETTLKCSCSCPAGDGPAICPHKLGVLLSETSTLADLQDLPALAQVHQWLQQTSFMETWQQLKDLENVLITVNRQIHEVQTRLDGFMKNGIILSRSSEGPNHSSTRQNAPNPPA